MRRRFEALFENRIVLYGAGITGMETRKVLSGYFNGVDIACFCDARKSGSLDGLLILSPDDLIQAYGAGSILVIITALGSNREEIAQNLRRLGVPPEAIYTLAELDELIARHIDDDRIDDWYRAIKRCKLGLRRGDRRDLFLDWWCPEHYRDGDVLVYQPGKVGSSSICSSLYAAGVSVTHLHMLTDAYIYDLVPETPWTPEPHELALITEASRLCTTRIRRNKRLKIISPVREPLSRDYSQFVYHLGERFGDGALPPFVDLLEACADGIRRRATQNGKSRYGYQFEWFVREMKAVFGVDVYDESFSQEAGFVIIRHPNVEILLVKLERLNDLAPIVGQFAGAKDFQLVSTNQASQKQYKNLYSAMRRRLRLPADIVSLYYQGNPLMDHFYSEQEKARFLASWAGEPTIC